MLLKNYFDSYKFKTVLSINVVLLFFVFNISTHAETTNISGVVTSVEVLTANYIEEVPETRNICEIRQVPITAQKKSSGPSENKLLGAIIGGVLGAQLGARVTVKLKAEEIRILLAIIVLLVCLKLALDLMMTPNDLFSITYGSGS